MPKVADGVAVRYLDPAAPWAAAVGASPTGTAVQAGVVLRVSLLFDDAKASIREVQEWEAVLTPLGEVVDPAAAVTVDHDDRDLRTDAPPDVRYLPTEARIDTKGFYTDLSKRVKDMLIRDKTLTIPVNRTLKLWVGSARPRTSSWHAATRPPRPRRTPRPTRSGPGWELGSTGSAAPSTRPRGGLTPQHRPRSRPGARS